MKNHSNDNDQKENISDIKDRNEEGGRVRHKHKERVQ